MIACDAGNASPPKWILAKITEGLSQFRKGLVITTAERNDHGSYFIHTPVSDKVAPAAEKGHLSNYNSRLGNPR